MEETNESTTTSIPVPTFRKLGDEKLVQTKLGIAILTDYKFAMQMLEILDYQYFNLIYVRIVVEEYYNYFKKYKLFPSLDILQEITKDRLDVQSNEHLSLFIHEFYNEVRDFMKNPVDNDMPFVKDRSIDFCKKQKILQAMLSAQSMLDNCNFDEVATLLNNALQSGGERDVGLIYDIDIEPRIKELTSRQPVSSGYIHLDNLIRGGFGKGELIVFVAPTGGGKTTFLVNLGVNALKRGKKVAHYSLEMNTEVVALRYDSNILDMPLEDFTDESNIERDSSGEIKQVKRIKQEVLEKITNINSLLHENSKLIIKQYPSRKANINSIRNHLFKMAMMGVKPDLILVDYADLLKPSINRSEKRWELEEIYGELRALSVEHGCPIITASQTNRLGYDNEKVSLKEIGEAFAKAQEVDLALCFSRTTSDKTNGTARLLVAKNRNGKEGLVFPVRYYDDRYKMELLEACRWSELPTEFMANEEKNIKQAIRKYMDDE